MNTSFHLDFDCTFHRVDFHVPAAPSHLSLCKLEVVGLLHFNCSRLKIDVLIYPPISEIYLFDSLTF